MALASAVGSMGADLVVGSGVDELARVVAVLCGGGTMASVGAGIGRLAGCGQVDCRPVEEYDTMVVLGMLAEGLEELELDGILQHRLHMELW